MDSFRADLHCHSIFSDGSDTPLELLGKAKEAQLKGLSITDHDSIEAYTPEFFAQAEAAGIEILTGIEVSSEFGDATVHILGYGFDVHSTSFKTFLSEMQERRTKRNAGILKRLAERKIPISEEELMKFAKTVEQKKTIGRPHIAALMIQKGFVSSMQEAFERYLKEGALCYVSGFKSTPEEVTSEIRKAGGKAVLAHPHFLKSGSFLKKLLACSFDGIECYYGNLYKEQERPWVALAEKKGWVATGGSDYHGKFKPQIQLGCSWVGEATFRKLKAQG